MDLSEVPNTYEEMGNHIQGVKKVSQKYPHMILIGL